MHSLIRHHHAGKIAMYVCPLNAQSEHDSGCHQLMRSDKVSHWWWLPRVRAAALHSRLPWGMPLITGLCAFVLRRQ